MHESFFLTIVRIIGVRLGRVLVMSGGKVGFSGTSILSSDAPILFGYPGSTPRSTSRLFEGLVSFSNESISVFLGYNFGQELPCLGWDLIFLRECRLLANRLEERSNVFVFIPVGSTIGDCGQ